MTKTVCTCSEINDSQLLASVASAWDRKTVSDFNMVVSAMTKNSQYSPCSMPAARSVCFVSSKHNAFCTDLVYNITMWIFCAKWHHFFHRRRHVPTQHQVMLCVTKPCAWHHCIYTKRWCHFSEICRPIEVKWIAWRSMKVTQIHYKHIASC